MFFLQFSSDLNNQHSDLNNLEAKKMPLAAAAAAVISSLEQKDKSENCGTTKKYVRFILQ